MVKACVSLVGYRKLDKIGQINLIWKILDCKCQNWCETLVFYICILMSSGDSSAGAESVNTIESESVFYSQWVVFFN